MPEYLYIDFVGVIVIVTVSPVYSLLSDEEQVYVNFVVSPYMFILYFGSAFGYNVVFFLIVAVYL